jgi:transposase InsO family protein
MAKTEKIPYDGQRTPLPTVSILVDDLEITHKEQVWVWDITYIRIDNGFVYLAAIMDVFTRSIRS